MWKQITEVMFAKVIICVYTNNIRYTDEVSNSRCLTYLC